MLDLIPSGEPPAADVSSASPALLGKRARATLLDVVLCYVFLETVPLSFVIWAVPEWTAGRTLLLVLGSVLLLFPLYLTYCFALEWWFAQTPGKIWQELVVTTPSGRPPTLVEAATRNLLRYVDFLPVCYLLGWYLVRQSENGQRLGDRISGTIVARATRK